jgi:phosphoglycolate phosphatase
LLRAIELLGVSPSEALMVGDNHHDVSAARAAGMAVIAVTWGYSHVPHHELGADRLINSFGELLPLPTDAGSAAQAGVQVAR